LQRSYATRLNTSPELAHHTPIGAQEASEQNAETATTVSPTADHSIHTYEIRPRKNKRGFDLISDALPFGGLWYLEVGEAVS